MFNCIAARGGYSWRASLQSRDFLLQLSQAGFQVSYMTKNRLGGHRVYLTRPICKLTRDLPVHFPVGLGHSRPPVWCSDRIGVFVNRTATA